MEFVRRQWLQVRAFLEGVGGAEKTVIVLLLVLGIIGIAWFVNWAASPERVPISAFAAKRSGQVLARLRAAGIDADRSGAQITVPLDERDDAILLLVEDNLLADNASAAFDELIVQASPWETRDQGNRKFLIVKQMVLGRIIRGIEGIRMAEVMIDMPRDMGFGKTVVSPSASVTITTRAGRGGDKSMVQALAALVSGAVAEMEPINVKVIIDGRISRVDDENDLLPTTMMEFVGKKEQITRDKILYETLNYIPGVLVAVNVLVDPTRTKLEKAWEYEKTEPVRIEESEETSRKETVDAGEPGGRSMMSMDIADGTGTGSEESTTRERREYNNKGLIAESHTTSAGHTVKQINVSVGVPRGYFAQLFKSQNPEAAGDPTDADLQQIIGAQLTQIKKKVMPLTVAKEEGQVLVDMIPDLMLQTAGLGAATGIGAMLESGWAKPVGVGVLALVSLALMLGMVRKATRAETLPSVEELAGVPPRLSSDEELVGEVEETEMSMAGVELNEAELKSRKMAEQISDLIRTKPAEAGSILSQWVKPDE